MTSQSSLKGQGGVTLRVVVRTSGLDTFIQKYSRFVKEDRIFIFTKSSQPPGTRVRFTLELTDGQTLISGEGTVTRVRGESGDPAKPPGMELSFRPIDESSQRIVGFMLAERAAQEEAQKEVKKALAAAPIQPTSPMRQATLPVLPKTASMPSVTTIDELTHHFPATDAPPAFVDSFRASDGLVPANPFSEVSDNAIEYFVEWSLERSTAPRDESEEPAHASFGNVKMVSPSIELEVAKLDGRPRSRLPSLLFGCGLGLGLTLGVAGHFLWGRHARPHSPPAPPAASSSQAQAGREPLTPPPKREESPSPAPQMNVRAAISPPAAATPKNPTTVDPATSAGLVRLAVISQPPGATIVIDGKESGHTPLETRVSAGRHRVELTLDRYADASHVIEAPGSVNVVMKRPHATLTVESNPAGAEVLIRGEHRGRAPVTVGLLAFESYDLQVQLAGERPWKRRVYLKGPTTKVMAQLAPPEKTTPYPTPRGRVTGIR